MPKHGTNNSNNKLRTDIIQLIKNLEPSPESIKAIESYSSKVDDKSSTNNYAYLVKCVMKDCTKTANPKFWTPINSQINTEKLIHQLGFDWPSRTEQAHENIQDIFNEIDQSYQNKGLKSSRIPNVTTLNKPNPQQQQSNNDNNNPTIQTARASHNPILDDERLKNFDAKICERILSEVLDKKQDVCWDDIAGLQQAKQAINEIVVYPMLNPKIFTGLLAPAKGLLLFGPPGTGKTLIGKCIACESKATFFAISASSLTSKWIGEGEKMVRALFAVARVLQPSVVFIDEIDSLLTQRTDGEHDSSRKMKTEFLIQLDGVSCEADERVLIVGATNRPQELDEAARRRFTKRLYIPLPDKESRKCIILRLLKGQNHDLTDECIDFIGEMTKGYSGADMTNLCKEAAMGPIRTLLSQKIVGGVQALDSQNLPAISRKDFVAASKQAKATVSQTDLGLYDQWNRDFGSVGTI